MGSSISPPTRSIAPQRISDERAINIRAPDKYLPAAGFSRALPLQREYEALTKRSTEKSRGSVSFATEPLVTTERLRTAVTCCADLAYPIGNRQVRPSDSMEYFTSWSILRPPERNARRKSTLAEL